MFVLDISFVPVIVTFVLIITFITVLTKPFPRTVVVYPRWSCIAPAANVMAGLYTDDADDACSPASRLILYLSFNFCTSKSNSISYHRLPLFSKFSISPLIAPTSPSRSLHHIHSSSLPFSFPHSHILTKDTHTHTSTHIMATIEKTKEQQKQFQVPDYDSEDYDSADDDIEYSEDEEEDQTVPNKNQQLQRRRRQQQQQSQGDLDDYSDEDDYDSEYDDEDDYSDDEVVQGKSMQPWSQGTTSGAPSGGMNVIPQEQKKSLDDEEGMKLKLELNLEIEIELKARIHGDLTLALM